MTNAPTTGKFIRRRKELSTILQELSKDHAALHPYRIPVIQTAASGGTAKSALLQELARILNFENDANLQKICGALSVGGSLQRLKSYLPIPITWNHCTRMDSSTFDERTLVPDELKRLRSSIAMRIVYTVFVPQRRHSQSYFQEFQEDWDSHSIPGNVIPRILQQVQKAIGEKNILLLVDEASKTLVPKNV